MSEKKYVRSESHAKHEAYTKAEIDGKTTPQETTLTVTSKVSSAVRKKVYKVGRLVVVNITLSITETTEYRDIIATGFPKPLDTNVFYAAAKEFVLNTDGELYINNGFGAALGYITIAGTYITEN